MRLSKGMTIAQVEKELANETRQVRQQYANHQKSRPASQASRQYLEWLCANQGIEQKLKTLNEQRAAFESVLRQLGIWQ